MASQVDPIGSAKQEVTEHIEVMKVPRKGVDEALLFLDSRESMEWTEEEEKQVLQKIDRRMLPLMFFAAFMFLADSQIFGYAAIFGMVVDLKLYTITSLAPLTISLTKYSFSSSILFAGTLASQYPLLYLAQRLPIGKFSGVLIFYAGALALLMVTVTNFSGLMALRFFFGFVSTLTPLSIIITAMWWKTDEQPLRIGVWFSGATIGTLVGGAYDYGVVGLKGRFEHSPWKWMYLVMGSIVTAYGLVYFFLLPDSPMTANFLTEREKCIAILRIQKNNTGIKSRAFKLEHFIDSLKDPNMYILSCATFVLNFVNAALGTFGIYLTTSFGYSSRYAILLLMGLAAVAATSTFISGALVAVFPGRRIFVCIGSMLWSIIGLVLLWQLPRDNKTGLLAGLYLFPIFYAGYAQIFSLLSANVATSTKKTTINATSFIMASLGGFAGPFSFKANEATKGYPTGVVSCLVLIVVLVVLLVLLYFYYRNFNGKQESRLREELAANPALSEGDLAFLDLTERENVFFRYKL